MELRQANSLTVGGEGKVMGKMRQACLTVTLNPAIDRLVCCDRFRAGHEQRCPNPVLSAGGKGINVARALRRLGVAVTATGFAGGAAGEFLRREMAREGVAESFVRITGESRDCLTVRERSGRLTRLIPEGPRVSAQEIRSFLRHYDRLLPDVTWVVLSGRGVAGAGDDFYAQLIRRARRQGKRVVLDASGPQLRLGLAAGPDFVKPNRAEAEFLLGRTIKSGRDAGWAAEKILTTSTQGVIVSLGPDGIAAADRLGTYVLRPVAQPVINTVGCGDSLVAGFVAAMMSGKNFVEALTRAVAAGVANTLTAQPGAIARGKVAAIERKLVGKIIVGGCPVRRMRKK